MRVECLPLLQDPGLHRHLPIKLVNIKIDESALYIERRMKRGRDKTRRSEKAVLTLHARNLLENLLALEITLQERVVILHLQEGMHFLEGSVDEMKG